MSTEIPISKLEISEFNVRKKVGDLTELTESIKNEGILQPLLVRPENGRFGIVIGSRRFEAAKLAKLKEVPVMIKNLDDGKAGMISLVENIQRNNLTVKEECESMLKSNQAGYSQVDIAKQIGKRQQYVSEMLLPVTGNRLLYKLEDAGMEIKHFATKDETDISKAIPLYHAIW